MAQIEIYTKPTCGYCHMAKRLLNAKGVTYAEVNISAQPEKRAEMIQKSGGGTTVPQIFISGRHIGGCDDLMALERGGKLDALLAA
ncbi:MAG: glutaredoxin 3 [Pseudomonadota bacterium]